MSKKNNVVEVEWETEPSEEAIKKAWLRLHDYFFPEYRTQPSSRRSVHDFPEQKADDADHE